MSHMERLLSLLDDMGLTKKDNEDDVRNPWSAGDKEYALVRQNDAERWDVFIGRGEGYSGFYCCFSFNDDGSYLEHSCGE